MKIPDKSPKNSQDKSLPVISVEYCSLLHKDIIVIRHPLFHNYKPVIVEVARTPEELAVLHAKWCRLQDQGLLLNELEMRPCHDGGENNMDWAASDSAIATVELQSHQGLNCSYVVIVHHPNFHNGITTVVEVAETYDEGVLLQSKWLILAKQNTMLAELNKRKYRFEGTDWGTGEAWATTEKSKPHGQGC